jgi:hypothetical protein
MQDVASFRASDVPPETLSGILADYLALDQARLLRRLLVTRFGALAAVAILVAVLVPGLSIYARAIPTGLFVAPPIWAWIAELRLERRLSQTLDAVGSVRKS